MAKQRTRAQLAAENDALRHQVFQLEGDLIRTRDQVSVLQKQNDMLRSDLNKHTRYTSRAQAMQAAREEAIRTGKSVPVLY